MAYIFITNNNKLVFVNITTKEISETFAKAILKEIEEHN